MPQHRTLENGPTTHHIMMVAEKALIQLSVFQLADARVSALGTFSPLELAPLTMPYNTASRPLNHFKNWAKLTQSWNWIMLSLITSLDSFWLDSLLIYSITIFFYIIFIAED